MGDEEPRELRLTPRVHRLLGAADQKARDLGHDYVGAEHILLALLRDGSVAAAAIADLGVTDQLESRLMEIIGSEGYNTPAPG